MEARIWKIEWIDAMSVGIPEIDEDEKRFIALVDAFNRSVVDRMDISEIRNRLQYIVDDAEQHFSNEEKLLNGRRYPNLGEHAIKHTELKNLVRYILEDSISYGTDMEWINAGLTIKDALIKHILIEDHKYAEYYRNSRSAGTAGKV